MVGQSLYVQVGGALMYTYFRVSASKILSCFS